MRIIEAMRVEELSLHAEALTTPRMNDEQYQALKRDIEMNGQIDPVTVYRGKIIDGRHRWLILQELGIETILVEKLPNNTTIAEIRRLVRSRETRRHESASQLAISAYKYILTSTDKVSQTEAADMFGTNAKRIGEAKKIAEMYGRTDILDLLFNGEKFNVGNSYRPIWSDSLRAILNWLAENGTVLGGKDRDIGIAPRLELTEDEQIIVNKFIYAIRSESKLVKNEVANVLYTEIKGDE